METVSMYSVIGWEDLPTEEKCVMLRDMWKNETGKYIGYFKSLEGSGIGFSDVIEVLKDTWCFGMKIFDNNGLTKSKLKELFSNPPEQGVILTYLETNLTEIYKNGTVRF